MSISGKITAFAVLSAGLSMASPAQATDTFAQFAQIFSSARIFTYTNTSGGTEAELGTVAGSNTVLISDIGLLASASFAKVSLVGTASALPTVGITISQLFSGSLTFTLLAPQVGLSGPSVKALTITFTNAALLASPGGSAPTIQASSDAGSVITYASDFADLSGTTSEDFALSFSGASLPLIVVGGRLPDFYVSGSGTFAAILPAPEPATWSLMLAGFGAVGGTMRRRKAAVAFT